MHTAGDTGLSFIKFPLDVCSTYLHKALGADNCSLGQGLAIGMGAIVVSPSQSSEVLGYPTQHLCSINGSKPLWHPQVLSLSLGESRKPFQLAFLSPLRNDPRSA